VESPNIHCSTHRINELVEQLSLAPGMRSANAKLPQSTLSFMVRSKNLIHEVGSVWTIALNRQRLVVVVDDRHGNLSADPF
jgi:hypothetical protein